MTTKHAYQLTKYPVGSPFEIWSMSWPLMLTIASGCVMFFADRLFLARYSVDAMNALAVAGIWTFFFTVLPMAICEITEVFVGKENGAEKNEDTSRPCWQMLWLSLCTWPLFIGFSRLFAPVIFGSNTLEITYFVTFLDFAPFQLMTIALSGFFIGIGRLKTVTWATIFINVLNIGLAPFLIFTCEMGITGAAIASGICFIVLFCILLTAFLHRSYRSTHNTGNWSIDRKRIREMLQVSVPSGLARTVEVLAHCLFFAIMAKAGFVALTTVTFVQSFYLLSCFVIDAIAKGTTSIISNLIGAQKDLLVKKVVKSACSVMAIMAVIVASFAIFSYQTILGFTLQDTDRYLLQDPFFLDSVHYAMLWMLLFFFFDGITWILAGHLTARSDTKFLLYTNLCTNFITYLVPIYFLVQYTDLQGVVAWAVIAGNSFVLGSIYFLRSRKFLALSQSSFDKGTTSSCDVSKSS